jgi:type I restriction enzyme S subunit
VFASLKAPCPPSEEQAAIVRFLDHANRKIDRFIRAKRKLIELLGEQKQAIIQRAVTRGLNPNVTLKASGIPWLGEIPEHWEVRKLKQCVTAIEQGWSPQCDANRASESEWGVLKVGCVNKDSFAPEQNKKLPKNLMPDPSLEILDGDILVSRANTRELLGLAAIAEMPRPKLILCDKLFRFRVRPQFFNSKFLVSALRSKPSRVQIESSTNGASSSMQNIGQGVLKKLWVSIPTIAEQERIVDYIASECEPLSTAVTRTELEIALIQEYRTRLTADIVTGKLDVREAAAKLPDLPTDTDCSSDAKTQDEELFEEPESGEE